MNEQSGQMPNLKVIHKDDTHTTLLHPAGHEIRLRHKSLKPEHIAELRKYAEGGDVPEEDAPEAAPAEYDWEVSSGATGPDNRPAAPTNMPIQQPSVAIPASTGNNPMQAMADAQGLQESGIKNAAAAQSAEGAQQVQAAKEQQAQSQSMAATYQQKVAELDSDRQAIMHDIGQGHIDPDHYINNLPTASKVGTAIGLILGGFGSGGHNPAMEYLQKNIDNDIAAQKSDLGRKENLLGALERQYGNLHDATLMAKSIYADIYGAKIAQAAASAKSPMAQAAAQQAIGQLRAQTAPLQAELATRQTVLQGLQNGAVGPAQAIRYMVPKEEQSKAFDDLGHIKEINKLHEDMAASFEHLKGQTLHGGFSPNDTESAKNAFAGRLEKLAEGRYNHDAVQNIITSLLPQKTDSDLTMKNKQTRMTQIMDSLRQEHSQRLEGYGLPVPQPQLKAADQRFSKTKK